MPKLKFPQYKVRGKYRDYYVIAFPAPPYMWPYHDEEDDAYIIDADVTAWQQLRYAIAVLLQAQDRIIYFPTKNNNRLNPMCGFEENYDTVLTVAGLHFKRSEWHQLRRQLKPANRVRNFALNYHPEKIVAQYEAEKEDIWNWRCNKLNKMVIKEMVSGTVFFNLPEEYYRCNFDSALDCEDWIQDLDCGWKMGHLGWIIPDKTIMECLSYNKKHSQEDMT